MKTIILLFSISGSMIFSSASTFAQQCTSNAYAYGYSHHSCCDPWGLPAYVVDVYHYHYPNFEIVQVNHIRRGPFLDYQLVLISPVGAFLSINIGAQGQILRRHQIARSRYSHFHRIYRNVYHRNWSRPASVRIESRRPRQRYSSQYSSSSDQGTKEYRNDSRENRDRRSYRGKSSREQGEYKARPRSQNPRSGGRGSSSRGQSSRSTRRPQ